MRIARLDDVQSVPVRHNPAVTKRMLLEPGCLPPLIQFAEAVFPPGESAPGHVHDNMIEVFHAVAGTGYIRIGDTCHALMPGTCVAVEPGEFHEVVNDGSTELVLLFFGLQCSTALT